MTYRVHVIDLYTLNLIHLNTKRGLKMNDRSITIVFASMLGFCMLAVMACTVWILFTGSAIELALGILGSAVSVYMFIDVSRDIK